MVIRHAASDAYSLLTRLRSKLLRYRKRDASAKPPIFYQLLLILCLLIPPIIFLLARLSHPLPSPQPLQHLQASAGGNQDYRITPLQQDVRNVTRTMYRAYMKSCMGRDEFEPTTNHCNDWFNVGLTVLDSLDTLVLMELQPEYQQSRQWVEQRLSFRKSEDPVSMFEIVIRAVGGLNSAYQLTNDTLWLNKSVELGDMLLQSFGFRDMPCPPPYTFIGDNIKSRLEHHSVDLNTSPAEAGTLQLEFRSLSRMTGDPKYAKAVDDCEDHLISALPFSGLATDHYNIKRNKYFGHRLAIGGGVDSFYEMLIKNWITWGKGDSRLRRAYETAVAGIFEQLSNKKYGHFFISELATGRHESLGSTMEHLSCFFPGSLALAALHGLGGGLHSEHENDYMPRARALTESCFAMTQGTASGLAGEVTDFQSKVPIPQIGHDMNYLRPEIVEALYYMDKLDPKAGDKYKRMGQTMWNALRKSAQVKNRPDGILSSTFNLRRHGQALLHLQKLNSFVIAETFKYFYLLFDERPSLEGPLSPNKWVYNTEAHPVRIVDHLQ